MDKDEKLPDITMGILLELVEVLMEEAEESHRGSIKESISIAATDDTGKQVARYINSIQLATRYDMAIEIIAKIDELVADEKLTIWGKLRLEQAKRTNESIIQDLNMSTSKEAPFTRKLVEGMNRELDELLEEINNQEEIDNDGEEWKEK